jgi:hypothetical protein
MKCACCMLRLARDIRRPRLLQRAALSAFLAVSIGLSQAKADFSLSCIYQGVTEAYEITKICGISVDVDSYRGYQEIRTMLGPYVHETGHRTTLSADLDETIRRHLQELGKNWVCRGEILPLVKEFVFELTKPARIDALRQRLRTNTDPDEGDCL